MLGPAIGLVAFVAGAWGVFLILVAAARMALGQDPRAPLVWGLALLLTASGGYGIFQWLYGGGSAAGVEASFIVSPADYYASRGEAFPASRYYPVEVSVVPVLPVHDFYTVTVDWGDGSVSSWPEGRARPPGEPASLTHVYHDVGLYTVSITITVYQWTGYGEEYSQASIVRGFMVNVTAPWYEYAGVVKSFISGIDEEGGIVEKGVKKAVKAVGPAMADAFAGLMDLMARVMAWSGLNAGYAFYFYVTMPTASNFEAVENVYGTMAMWALVLLPAAAMVRLVWKGFWEWESGGGAILEVFRDTIAVLVGIYVFLDLYDILASTVNTISLGVAQLGQLGALYSMIVSTGALASAVGLIAPSAGAMAGVVLVALILIVALGVLKWITAAAIVAVMPVLLALWLIPGLRGAVTTALHILSGLFIFSLVAGALSALTSQMMLTLTSTREGSSLVVAIAMPIIFALASHQLTNAIAGGLGMQPPLAIRPRLARAAGAGAAGAVAAAATAGGALLAGKRPMSGQVLGHAPSPLYQPRQPTVMTQPPSPSPTTGKPTIQEVPPPKGLERVTRPVKDVLAEARGEAETVEPSLKRRAAVAAAKAGLAAAGWARQQLRDFDQTLARETGITLGHAAQKTYHAGKWTAHHTIKAAQWAAPRVKHYAGQTWQWINSRINMGRAHASGRTLHE